MDEKDWLKLVGDKNGWMEVREANEYTEKFGLSLTEEGAQELMERRNRALKAEGRVEFGGGILTKIIYAFCDSDYVHADEWGEILGRLTEIFYLYKNEMNDEITDDELIAFMREQYDEVCGGDLDELEGTCLNLFAQAVRAGYRGYEKSGGYNEYGQFDLRARWSHEEFIAALNELCQ
ncbi:MAG: hypothetical protein K2N63_07545 [Lachnospiraceae bacterium]|nr:hypothetical protein [Lachnospiraceae bacterium]